MADIQLHRLISRYSTNPNQPPIPTNDTLNIVENVTTALDVVANDNCLVGRPRNLVSVNSAVNCTTVKSGNIVNVTGTSVGAGSFTYVVSDGTNTATGSVTLSVSGAGGSFKRTRFVTTSAPDESLRTINLVPEFSDTTVMIGQLVHLNLFKNSTFDDIADPFTEVSYVAEWGDDGAVFEHLPIGFRYGNQANITIAPFSAKFYKTAGLKTVKIYACRMVGGVITHWDAFEQEIRVVDPWAANTPANPHPYTDASTYIISAGGDTTGVNPAWTIYNTIEDLFKNHSFAGSTGPNIRIGFLAGHNHVSGHYPTFTGAFDVPTRIRNRDTYVSSWGTGSRPNITINHFRVGAVFDVYTGYRFTLYNIDCTGQYDPVTGKGAGFEMRLVSNNGCNRVSITSGVCQGIAMTCRNDNGAVPVGQVMTAIGYGDRKVKSCYDYGFGLQPEARWQKAMLIGCHAELTAGTVTGPGGKDLNITTGSIVTTGAVGESYTLNLPANYIGPELFDASSIAVYRWDESHGWLMTELNSAEDGFTITTTGIGTGANGTGSATITWPAGSISGRTIELTHVAWADHSEYRSPSDFESVYSQCYMANDDGWSTPPEGTQSGIRLVQGGAVPNNEMVGMSFCLNQCVIDGGFHVFSMQAANTSSIRVDEIRAIVESFMFIGVAETWDACNLSYSGVLFRNGVSDQVPNSTSDNNANNSVFSLGYGVNLVGGTNGTGKIGFKGLTLLQRQSNSGVGPSYTPADWRLFEYAGGASSCLYNANIQFSRVLMYALDANPINPSTGVFDAALQSDPMLEDMDAGLFEPQVGSRALANAGTQEVDPELFEDEFGRIRINQIDGAVIPA
jgi:hypothetical protein